MAMTRLESLKEKWAFTGIDVEKMIEDIVDLLHKYGHKATKYGAMVLLDEYINNKAELIKIMMNDPDYNGNLQIVKSLEFEREKPQDEIQDTIIDFEIANVDKVLSRKNAEGKTVEDIIKEKALPKVISLKGIENINLDTVDACNEFDGCGYTMESLEKQRKFRTVLNVFARVFTSTIDEDVVEGIKNILPDFRKVGNGQKTARAFQALCKYFGIDTSTKEFQKWFACYSDMVSGLKRKMLYVISVNPIDYYTMSFGKSWASCHTIDYRNVRKMPGERYNGMYRGGTQSYMLDNVSIVTYVLNNDASKEHPETEAKIYRNMMHYQNGILVQGRIYPQGKDGATDLYKELRRDFQEIWRPLIGTEENFVLKGGSAWDYRSNYFTNVGTHYPDTVKFSDCKLSYVRGYQVPPERLMVIGHTQICTVSGMEMFDHGELYNPSSRESDYPDSLMEMEIQ